MQVKSDVDKEAERQEQIALGRIVELSFGIISYWNMQVQAMPISCVYCFVLLLVFFQNGELWLLLALIHCIWGWYRCWVKLQVVAGVPAHWCGRFIFFRADLCDTM